MDLSIYNWSLDWAKNSPHNTYHQDTCESTNLLAKKKDLEKYSLFLCDQQSQGKGRGNNSWENPKPGSSLMATWVFTTPQAPQHLSSLFIGHAVYKSLITIWPRLPLSLKAPNDLYLNDKKIAGVLTESISEGSNHRLIVGIGLNVNDSPILNTSSHLSNFLDNQSLEQLNEKKWYNFLDELDRQLQHTSTLCSSTALDKKEQADLCQALNRFPLLETPYSKIDDEGNLWTKNNEKISWRSILD